MEFDLRKIPFMRQERVGITYKGRSVGKGKLDLFVGGRLIVELKSVERLAPIHSAQVISYLRMTSRILGLLINFNVGIEGRNKASCFILRVLALLPSWRLVLELPDRYFRNRHWTHQPVPARSRSAALLLNRNQPPGGAGRRGQSPNPPDHPTKQLAPTWGIGPVSRWPKP